MNWHDDLDLLDRVAIETLSGKRKTAAGCCDAPEVHIHAHRGWAGRADRCSAWIWCSHCGAFAHLDGIPIHGEWTNNPAVDFTKVCAVPVYLETKKD